MFLSTWLTSLIFCLCLLQGRNSCSIFFDNEKCYLSATFRAMCSDLNDSQKAAVLNCISLSKCNHRNSIKLIWGPPVTGKTKTVGLSLFALVKLKCRTLTCAPTNIAVLEVTARVLSLVNQSLDYGKYGHGDIILFGNEERMIMMTLLMYFLIIVLKFWPSVLPL